MSQKGKKCGVCDFVNVIVTPTCKNCNARLMKKRSPSRSKQSRGRDKYKRKKSTCSGNKDTFGSKRQAKAIAQRIQEKSGRMSKIYYCKTCKGYHLTKFKA